MPFFRRVTCGIAFCLGFAYGAVVTLAKVSVALVLYKLGKLS